MNKVLTLDIESELDEIRMKVIIQFWSCLALSSPVSFSEGTVFYPETHNLRLRNQCSEI